MKQNFAQVNIMEKVMNRTCGLHPQCGVLFIFSGKKRMIPQGTVSFIRRKKPTNTRKEEAAFAEKGPA